jgi:predicted transcriptional regulator
MAISNELSSEIAAAMLAQKKSPQELRKLSEIVLQVHNALQKMSQHAATERTNAKAAKVDRNLLS